MGEILAPHRNEVVLATKVGSPMSEDARQKGEFGASPDYIVKAVENSLRRLKTDYIDLLQIHYPDPFTPIERTLEALGDLVAKGKVRYIGCSNFSGDLIVRQHCLTSAPLGQI